MGSFLLLSPGLLDAKILPFLSVGVAVTWSRSDSPKHVLVFPQSPFFGDFFIDVSHLPDHTSAVIYPRFLSFCRG